jgi:methylation protein EvaC
MSACLVCGTSLEPFLSFGKMPIANGFLTTDQFAAEYFFELKVAFCPSCHMVQLTELVDRERMFHEDYAFFSSTSVRMAEHFERYAAWVRDQHLPGPDPFVVEMGSNDGILLRHFADAGIRHLGVEPSANVAIAARGRGVQTIGAFFDAALARRIVSEHGQADAVLGANVVCHVPYIHSVFEGVAALLRPRGVLVFEDPYLGDIVEKASYDQIYDEHAFYFSVSSIGHLAAHHDLEIIDVLPQAVHGGSLRYVLARKGAHALKPSVAQQRDRERALGLHQPPTYDALRRRIETSRDRLRRLLLDVKAQGKRVVGYAATSKSTTVTNYCGITPDLVEFISDTTPTKQGRFSPGAHIPVRPHAEFAARYPDYALLFGWNHAGEIRAKEAGFRAAGGRWIEYVPEVRITE